jgi:hypothetical protein
MQKTAGRNGKTGQTVKIVCKVKTVLCGMEVIIVLKTDRNGIYAGIL